MASLTENISSKAPDLADPPPPPKVSPTMKMADVVKTKALVSRERKF